MDRIKYKVEKINSNTWSDVLNIFDDSSVYQTESFAKYSLGGDNIEQFIVFQNDKIVTAALVRLKIVPILNKGLAYIRWAPLHIGPITNKEFILSKTLELLKDEYVKKRKLVLRIMSNIIENDNYDVQKVFIKYGFNSYTQEDQTIIINLKQSEEALRSNLRKKWRYSLKQAEKNNLELEIGDSDEHFEIFLSIFNEMHSRKKFNQYVNILSFKDINRGLPQDKKMLIFICKYDSNPVSAVIVSRIGKTGIYLLGGSTKKGLEIASSYKLQWEVILWMKKHGFETYDLGGIDKNNNPGVYTFKSGMGGDEVNYAGGFESSQHLISRVIVNTAEKIRGL